MKSIKFKIGALVLICVLLSAAMIGVISIQSSQKVVTQYSTQLMEQKCDGKAERINALLSRIEQSVVTLSDYALSQLDDIKKFQTDKEYVRQYSNKMSEIAINAADNTEGAMSVYIRFNPTFTEPTSGLFASRESISSSFNKLIPTDFSMYDSSDTAHVGWYYIPMQKGKPTWLAPYLNENLNVHMISFVVPLVSEGVSVGIIGMDIDFNIIEKLIDETKIYQSGYAFLTDENSEDVYRPSVVSEDKSSWQKQTASLKNGMNFILTAPSAEINAEADSLTRQIGLLSIAGIVFALIVSSIVIRGITKPLRELNTVAGKISDGELNVTVHCNSNDEVGMLADSFRKIVERLRTYISYIQETSAVLQQLSEGDLVVELKKDYIGEFSNIKDALITISETLNTDIEQIKIASEQISIGSEQVAQGAHVLSLGTSEQTSAIDELAIQIRDLSERIKANVDGARIVNELADKAGVDLQHNGKQMEDMVKAIDLISLNGEAIIRMTKAIDDIAMQTNILALNASIEAARAGAAGKGFSIVAEEVKNLAVKSTDTANHISELIKNTMEAISNGAQIAYETQRSVLDTATGAKAVVGIVEQIVADSDEQSRAVEKVLENVDKISAVVQQTSATSEEGAASAEELSSQAQMMSGLVEKFKLR